MLEVHECYKWATTEVLYIAIMAFINIIYEVMILTELSK